MESRGIDRSTVGAPESVMASEASPPQTMRVTTMPSADLVSTNLAFCSCSDVSKFAVPNSKLVLGLVSDTIVLSIIADKSIHNGCIALNANHRWNAKVSSGDTVSVSRYIPKEPFKLALLSLESQFVNKGTKSEQIDPALSRQIRTRFFNQVMSAGQRVSIEYHDRNYIFTVKQAVVEKKQKTKDSMERGMISSDTNVIFEAQNSSDIKVNMKIVNQPEAVSSKIFRVKEFNLKSLGIGGLSAEFADIFKRALASRVFPPLVTNKLGIKHVKGILLYGPPGTGKTLMARQIGKMLKGKEPKIVNGPEVLSKVDGETEKHVRNLFADAEKDQLAYGDKSDLHVIIFDEIDAVCKSRGSTRDDSRVVNQLLSKIDGIKALNNIFLIGVTNRKDLLDEALLRPGRLEVQVEISLPDETGRLEILEVHTKKMKDNSFLGEDVILPYLATQTKNYSGAELEGVVKCAVSNAMNRLLNLDDLTKPVHEESIRVMNDDFLLALREIAPAFRAPTIYLERCRVNGMVDCGVRHRSILEKAMLLVKQARGSKKSPLVTCLFEGPSGSGKSSMAARVGIDSNFPYVKIISAETMIGLSESSKCAQIDKVFEDAYKSQLSIIILDDIERLLEYVNIGPRFSDLVYQTLLILLKRLPPEGKNIIVIGTTSKMHFLESLDIIDAFSFTYHVPTLRPEEVKQVLEQLNVFAEEDISAAAEVLKDLKEMPIKKLFMLIELAIQGDFRFTDCVSSH